MSRIVFISHGHPALSKGGAEVASWNLYKWLVQQGHDCLYIARSGAPSHGGSTFSKRGNEVIFHTGMTDWFNLSTSKLTPLFNDLGQLLAQFKPDIVHIHHYAHMGIELFPAVRRAVPNAKLVFTLHEFMAMCMHNGQMVKKDSLKLCNSAEPLDCHGCFPQHSPSDFFLRKHYVQDQLSYVDAFVSPSQFLAKRYIEWGLPARKMHVIENLLPSVQPFAPRPMREGEKRARFAFFGQINPYKGLDVLLQAIMLLPQEVRSLVQLDIHGANLEHQTADFQEKVRGLLAQAGNIVQMRGAYEPEQLPSRIKECDWVIIPSIWWENSPVVIQEAIHYGRPLIGSNIGGMKEKIAGKAGLTFEARSAASLASAIQHAMQPEVFDEWAAKLCVHDNVAKEHQAFLAQLLQA